MKKIVLCLLLIVFLLVIAGCSKENTIDLSKLETSRHIMVVMPDGEIVRGICTNFFRFSDDWVYAKIDGIPYYFHAWRAVTWEK